MLFWAHPTPARARFSTPSLDGTSPSSAPSQVTTLRTSEGPTYNQSPIHPSIHPSIHPQTRPQGRRAISCSCSWTSVGTRSSSLTLRACESLRTKSSSRAFSGLWWRPRRLTLSSTSSTPRQTPRSRSRSRSRSHSLPLCLASQSSHRSRCSTRWTSSTARPTHRHRRRRRRQSAFPARPATGWTPLSRPLSSRLSSD